MLNKKTKFKTLLTTVLIGSMIGVTVASISHLEEKTKYLKSNSSILIDNEILECYDSCSDINSSIYKSLSADYLSFKEQLELTVREKVEKDRLAEITRVEELARIEAERKHKEELEKERLRRIEEKKKESAIVSRSNGYQSEYETTFYTSKCKGCTGQSASGEWVNKSIYYQGYRVVAAPPNIKFFTKLRITFNDGSSIDAIVLDRGSDIQGKRLDILVESKDEAYRLGRQQVKVEILK